MESINLKLEEDPSDHVRHLTIPVRSNHILAYGGPNGTISALPLSLSLPLSDEVNSPRIIKRFDEPVKALAFSSDGRRVAVGYEDGHIDIFAYTQEELTAASTNASTNASPTHHSHPFISNGGSKKKNKDNNDDDDDIEDEDDDDDDDFLTQSSQFQFGDDQDSTNSEPTFRLQHRFESSIRHLQFRPQSQSQSTSTSSSKYYLAIAVESSPGFMITDVSSTTASTIVKYLDDEATSAYHQGGVRSLSFSPNGDMISTLGMDGRLCLWDTNGDDPTIDWELLHKDDHLVVDKVDLGEFADVADKSLCPIWNHDGSVLGIPGSVDLKLRIKDKHKHSHKQNQDDSKEWYERSDMILDLQNGKEASDVKGIVGLAFDPSDDGYVVTSARDGKIALWQIFQSRKNEDQPTGQFVKEITNCESMCTHILWHKDETTKKETLFLALENGSMMTMHGRASFIPLEVQHQQKQQKQKQQQKQKVNLQEQVSTSGSITSQLQKKSNVAAPHPSDDEEEEEHVFLEDQNDNINNMDKVDESESSVTNNKFVEEEAEVDDAGGLNDDVDDDDDTVLHDDGDDNDDDTVDKNLTNDTVHDDVEDNRSTISHGTSPHHVPTNDNGDFYEDNDGDGDDDYDLQQPPNSSSMNYTGTTIHELQLPFTPSSTPQVGSRSILCWNHVGVITSRHNDYKSIDISFTDTTANRPVTFRDPMNFVLASLSEQGGLFATDLMDNNEDEDGDNDMHDLEALNGMSEATKAIVKKSRKKNDTNRSDRYTGSCIFFRRFETKNSNKEKDWQMTLAEGEKVLCCATGDGWSAVATSRHFLRTYTSAGVQGPIIWLQGEPVAMVGRGRFIGLFYHQGNPFVDGRQNIAYTVYDGITMKEVCSGPVSAIGSGSTITWAGFSNDFSLSVMNDDGMFSMLMANQTEGKTDDHPSFSWVPMLDTVGLRKSREDSFWPVSVLNGKLICVPLKGISFPDPVRRPVTAALNLRMPLSRSDGGKSFGMEEVSLRANLALSHKSFLNEFLAGNDVSVDNEEMQSEYDTMCAQVDKITLKLFFSFLSAGKTERGLDMVNRLHLEKSFDIAFTAADRLGHQRLGDRIFDKKNEKFKDDDFDDNQSYDESIMSASERHHRRDDESIMSSVITPEVTESRGKRIRQDFDEPSVKPKRRKKANPFATITKKSPSKTPLVTSPPPKKPALSRMSTFSAESRWKSKASKELI